MKQQLDVAQNLSIFSRSILSANDYNLLNSRYKYHEPILELLEDNLIETEKYFDQWGRREGDMRRCQALMERED